MRNRKSQVSSTLVIMVAGLIGLLVLIIVTGGFAKVFKSITGKSDCQMQFLVSSFTKAGGAQTVDPECEPHLVTVTQESLDKGKTNALKALKSQLTQNNIAKYNKIDSFNQYNTQFGDMNDQKKQSEWVMDKTIADEMKYCWDITGRGKLDLFSNWGTIMCTPNGTTNARPCTSKEIEEIYKNNKGIAIVSGIAGGVIGYKVPLFGGITTGLSAGTAAAAAGPLVFERIIGNIKEEKNPTFCVLCARIKFDNAVISSKENNLGVWLANNPVTDTGGYSKVSYAQYLENDAYKGIFAGDYSYTYIPNKAYAVIYARINVFQPLKLANQGINLLSNDNNNVPKDIQMIKLVDYSTVKDECTFLVG